MSEVWLVCGSTLVHAKDHELSNLSKLSLELALKALRDFAKVTKELKLDAFASDPGLARAWADAMR